MTIFIGLGHTSRCGKDTFADSLVKYLNAGGCKAKKISFAWKMKEIAYDLYAWAGVRKPEYYDTKKGEKDRDIRLEKLKSDIFPNGPTVVDLWIAIGTPAFREAVYPLTWVNQVLKSEHKEEVIVIPDCRFQNEIDAVRAEKGHVFRVVRRGFPGRDSIADKQLRGVECWDGTLGGDSVDELDACAEEMALQIRSGDKPYVEFQFARTWTEVYYDNLTKAGFDYAR